MHRLAGNSNIDVNLGRVHQIPVKPRARYTLTKYLHEVVPADDAQVRENRRQRPELLSEVQEHKIGDLSQFRKAWDDRGRVRIFLEHVGECKVAFYDCAVAEQIFHLTNVVNYPGRAN